MLAFLEFATSGFWTFCGVIILVGVILDGAAAVIRAIVGGKR